MEFGEVEINDELWAVLRRGQRNALELAFEYLNQDQIRHSCLVSMPTGGGKTGVISLLAHFGLQQKILVICHRSAVREQLVRQLSGEFFTDRLPDSEFPLRQVIDGVALIDGESINVTTFQMLSSLPARTLSSLVEAIDLVIVDEGHSEPSPIWSEISRSFEAHKVIITATLTGMICLSLMFLLSGVAYIHIKEHLRIVCYVSLFGSLFGLKASSNV